MHCEGKLKLRSHNTSYCFIEVITLAGLTVVNYFGGPNRFAASEFHTKCPNLDNVLWWWPSRISDPHKQRKFVRDYAMTFQIQ